MKKWRKEARKYNLEAGMKHQGRRNKTFHYDMKGLPSVLFIQLFMRSAKTALIDYDKTMSRYEKPVQLEPEAATE